MKKRNVLIIAFALLALTGATAQAGHYGVPHRDLYTVLDIISVVNDVCRTAALLNPKPITVYTPPATTYVQPATTYVQPTVTAPTTYVQPATTYVQPVVTAPTTVVTVPTTVVTPVVTVERLY